MRPFLASIAMILGMVSPSLADDYVPERRLVVTRDVDFYGSDLQSLFDTTYEACERACLQQSKCRAFTFNTRSNACFPKTDISDRQPYDGAMSAEVFDTDPAVLKQAQNRVAELGFLSDRDLSNAREVAQKIGGRHPSGQWRAKQLLDAANDRRKNKDYRNAMRWVGAAVSHTDTADQWIEYARLSLMVKSGTSSERRQYKARAVSAAINGFLRARNKPQQVSALQVLSDALEANRRGRDMIPALRLAERKQPRADITTALNRAIGKYGFRVTEHNVEHNSATPRLCAEFSEALSQAGVDYATYVKLPRATMSVQAEGSKLCVDGAEHGSRYQLTLREGLPAASGEKLARDVELSLYVRDRDPMVRFPGRAYVLPKSPDAGLPIETVNLGKVELTLSRVSDRNLLRAMQENMFGRPLSYYSAQLFKNEIGEQIWTGIGEVQNELNQNMTTRLPLAQALADQPAGIYALQAQVPGQDPYDNPGATQWFVLSDLGVTSLSGVDGLHVFVRSLGTAKAMPATQVSLLSRANRVLGTAKTDDQGYARFQPGLTRGQGAAAPALLLIEATTEQGETDMAFLSLRDPAFDLSDRGVEGREPSPPIDLFVTTDRGAYRAGETIFATALARDGVADAISDLPVTAILTRPDGVEYARHLSSAARAGGHVFSMPLGGSVPRGTWQLEFKTDLQAPALASRSILIEDFLPERIDFELDLPEGLLSPSVATQLRVDAKYLFGAPAADLKVEGEVRMRPISTLQGWQGYQFGRYDTRADRRSQFLSGSKTDAQGQASLLLELPRTDTPDRPYEVEAILRVQEGSGRPVERRITRALAPSQTMIGLKPLFQDVVAEGGEAAFQVVAIGTDLNPTPLKVRWTMNKVRRSYQWYQQYGNWNWEPITRRTRVASGQAVLGEEPIQLSAPVDWGHYELVVERLDGDYVASSSDFYAGWYAPADTSQTPDTLELSLDQPGYRSGDTAQLRVVPRYAGTALISVMSNRLITMKAVEVVEGENLIDLDVTEEWGAGAYVTAQVIRPMDVASGQNPARALGLSYAKIDPADKQLAVSIKTPAESAPRGPLDAIVEINGIKAGETAFVTVAAVDVGILNLTGFKSPDPSDHYFGQRRLGIEIRDLYGRLIDGTNGALGQVRSGGDAQNRMKMESPPPTEELVAYFTGPVQVDADGKAQVQFDLPEFNGTVRLMAVAWSDSAVGQASSDVLVRDPVVVTASLPRFLAPGDSSRLLLEIVHADGPSGRMGLDITAQGVSLDQGALPSGVTLAEQAKAVFSVPVTAGEIGDHSLRVALTTPDGRQLIKTLVLPVRANDPEVSRTQRLALAAGDSFTLDANVLAGLRAGSGQVLITAGPLGKMDVPGLLQTLDRYPYGCTEQVTSRAMPLLYLSEVAEAMGLGARARIQTRVDQAIERVLTRQASNGAFGLWRAESGDFWLDAYVSDFLSRARAEGYEVPDLAFRLSMENLRNRVNYAPDFDNGGEDLAYAVMVLAREGAAAMGDLRYYADERGDAFGTALAAAQLGAALAMYGDQTRADAMFARAARLMSRTNATEAPIWRVDYGTNLRDSAAVLSLAIEAGSNAVDRRALADRVATARGGRSTQEAVWQLMAARALVREPGLTGISIDGEPAQGLLVRKYDDAELDRAISFANTANEPTELTLTTLGVPEQPVEAGGYGYGIQRQYYDMQGNTVQVDQVQAGTRLVAVLRITPFEGGQARLMINDPLPAGFEIDNPNLLRSGDIRALDWLKPASAQHSEFRADRFLAAVDWRSSKSFELAYIVRAISPGEFHHPAATVEDMYRPQYRARTETGSMRVTE